MNKIISTILTTTILTIICGFFPTVTAVANSVNPPSFSKPQNLENNFRGSPNSSLNDIIRMETQDFFRSVRDEMEQEIKILNQESFAPTNNILQISPELLRPIQQRLEVSRP